MVIVKHQFPIMVGHTTSNHGTKGANHILDSVPASTFF